MTDALSRQVGGDHYKGMGMQPIEFAMANGWDAGAFSTLKYLSRHHTKNGLEDVRKGRHFVELRDAQIQYVGLPQAQIRMGEYIAANKITGWTRTALELLDRWVWSPGSTVTRDHLLDAIDQVIGEYTDAQKSLDLENTPLPR